MTAKVGAALITLGFHLVAGALILVFMLVIMNGFSESDARWGIYAYVVLAVVITTLMCSGSVFLAHRLAKRKLHAVLVTLISAAVFSTVGATLVSVSGFIGVMVADIVRGNF